MRSHLAVCLLMNYQCSTRFCAFYSGADEKELVLTAEKLFLKRANAIFRDEVNNRTEVW